VLSLHFTGPEASVLAATLRPGPADPVLLPAVLLAVGTVATKIATGYWAPAASSP
jgi:hypothetical protein